MLAQGSELSVYHWLGLTLFLIGYFLLPLSNNKVIYLVGLIVIMSTGIFVSFWDTPINLDILLLYSSVLAIAVLYLPQKVALILVFLPIIQSALHVHLWSEWFPFILFWLLILIGLFLYRNVDKKNADHEARYEALLEQYRKLKRQAATGEEWARQQERTEIAREIHDSVGHKLTALLMQIEGFRLHADESTSRKAELLKELARESLEETRKAVRTLNQDQSGGLPSIIQLIKRLEIENGLNIDFRFGAGVLSAPLGNEESITIYRVIQESLTNAMRHGTSREIRIHFETLGNRILHFEVENQVKHKRPAQEGFGLKNMKERMEEVGGEITILQIDQKFLIQARLPLKEEMRNDTDPIGRGPTHGTTRA